MAKLLWGQIYYKDSFAGRLSQEPGGRMSFTYDQAYLDSGKPSIAYTLPLQKEAFIHPEGLHPFFDNLVAEGWLEQAQSRLLGRRSVSRFELLLAYGHDCAGAVSVVDPEPVKLSDALLDMSDPKEMALLRNRASLSGVQPKLAIVEKNNQFFPAGPNEISTHIAKFPSRGHDDLVMNEYLTTRAFKALVGNDSVVDLQLTNVQGFSEPVLVIKRFDREAGNRVHFEEFNQLLGLSSSQKYDGAYKDMSGFIANTRGCLPAENYRLYLRILAGVLLGNTDMHFKNFALFHKEDGYRLTPSYDQVAAVLYDYKNLALAIGGNPNLILGKLKPGNVIKLAGEFNLSNAAVNMAFKQLDQNREAAKQAIVEAEFGEVKLKEQLIQLMEKRWNGLFALIGKALSKRQ